MAPKRNELHQFLQSQYHCALLLEGCHPLNDKVLIVRNVTWELGCQVQVSLLKVIRCLSNLFKCYIDLVKLILKLNRGPLMQITILFILVLKHNLCLYNVILFIIWLKYYFLVLHHHRNSGVVKHAILDCAYHKGNDDCKYHYYYSYWPSQPKLSYRHWPRLHQITDKGLNICNQTPGNDSLTDPEPRVKPYSYYEIHWTHAAAVTCVVY